LAGPNADDPVGPFALVRAVITLGAQEPVRPRRDRWHSTALADHASCLLLSAAAERAQGLGMYCFQGGIWQPSWVHVYDASPPSTAAHWQGAVTLIGQRRAVVGALPANLQAWEHRRDVLTHFDAFGIASG
jgi:hypothetical protein